MTKTYPQELHAIWNIVLHDPAVPAHSIIMEAMVRAFSLGCEVGVREERGAKIQPQPLL